MKQNNVKTIIELQRKLDDATKDILEYEREADRILTISMRESPWYPECHNDPTKTKCDHCMNCWDEACNESQCDAHGRCMCPNTTCICLGRV